MDASWFHQTLERIGATQADLARHLRLAPSAVSRMLKGERQMKQLETVQVAAFLGVSPDEVLRHAVAEVGSQPAVDMPRPGRGRPPSARPSGIARSPDMIPIRSAGRGGNDQEMFLQDEIGYTPRPANLGGVRAAYAIYMVGDSMEPRYEQNWLLHVNPFKPPRRGRDVRGLQKGAGGADQAVRRLGGRYPGAAPIEPARYPTDPALGRGGMPSRRRHRSGGLISLSQRHPSPRSASI